MEIILSYWGDKYYYLDTLNVKIYLLFQILLAKTGFYKKKLEVGGAGVAGGISLIY